MSDKKFLNTNSILQDCLSYTSKTLQGIEQWREILAGWFYHEKITPEEFENAFITLCRSGALNLGWIDYGWGRLYRTMTGEELDKTRLKAIADLFCPPIT